MHLIVALFERRADAEAARDELRTVHPSLHVKVDVPTLDAIDTPTGAHPVLLARVRAAQMPSFRRVVAGHRGQIMTDLDERYLQR